MDGIENAQLWTGWMTWEQIYPFKELIVDWELDVMIKYHYPDKNIPRSYPEARVEKLKDYLAGGSTFFWGAIENGELLGYYWAYIDDFLGEKRWEARSSYVCEKARRRGISRMAHIAALSKARELHCEVAVTSYASFNNAIAHVYEDLGYEISRIEVIKRLE